MKNTTERKIGLLIFSLLIVWCIASDIYMLTVTTAAAGIALLVAMVAVLLLLLYYVLIGYKIPHGNLLRIVVMAYGLYAAADIALTASGQPEGYLLLRTVTLFIIAYASGRLNKIKKNALLMPLALALMIITGIWEIWRGTISDPFQFTVEITNVIEWMIICVTYFIRYRDHKEAGLTDKE